MPSALRRLGVAVCVVLSLVAGAAGCAKGGGGAASGHAAGATGPAASASGASQAHWQVALAALGQAHVPQPCGFDAAGFARWNELIARNWPALRQFVDPTIEAQIRQIVGLGGTVRIQGIRNLVIDTAAPPALDGTSSGGAATLIAHIPGAPGAWRIACTAEVGATITTSVLGAPLLIAVSVDVFVDVSDVRVDAPVCLDLSNPARPMLAGAGAPALSMRLGLASSDPLLTQILAPLTQLLDPLVRAALIAGSVVAQQQLGAVIAQLPQAPWGLGAPPVQPVPGAAPLQPIADRISDDIQRDHMPFDTVLSAVFDQPGYGNGAVARYIDYGDSAIWTGHYLAGEALRYDLVAEPRALAGVTRAVRGLGGCLEVAIPGDGLLSRCIVPLFSPHIADIRYESRFFTGTVNGQPYGSLGGISRDQYIGTVLGLTQAFVRVPSVRAEAGALISRIVHYLETHDWVAYRTDGVTVSAPFAQTMSVAWSFIKSGYLVDPARWGWLHDRYKPLAPLFWLTSWASSREVHDDYYKFNLSHSHILNMASIETDPALYREYVKALDIEHDAVGHHDNAWFDAVYGIVVPSAAAALGPRVQAALERWALRDRRGFTVSNSQDPAIAKAVYASPTNPNGARLYAVHPVPIEKRPPTDFLWQRDPFELDGSGDPREQFPGVDLLLPYWAARSYGMIR